MTNLRYMAIAVRDRTSPIYGGEVLMFSQDDILLHNNGDWYVKSNLITHNCSVSSIWNNLNASSHHCTLRGLGKFCNFYYMDRYKSYLDR